MSDVTFVDTTLRDGNQSLWAYNMRTAAMLEAIEGMDRAGFESMEFFSATMIKKYVREHKENPWRWLREGSRRARATPRCGSTAASGAGWRRSPRRLPSS